MGVVLNGIMKSVVLVSVLVPSYHKNMKCFVSTVELLTRLVESSNLNMDKPVNPQNDDVTKVYIINSQPKPLACTIKVL